MEVRGKPSTDFHEDGWIRGDVSPHDAIQIRGTIAECERDEGRDGALAVGEEGVDVRYSGST